MLEELLPGIAAVVDTTSDHEDAVLFPEERELVAKAVPKRIREFTTTRHCARQAMRTLGVAPVAIARGERGAPQWPKGIVGSLTHTSGYRAAALAHTTDLLSIGIDAEPHAPMPAGVLDAVSLPAERDRIDTASAADPSTHWDRLLFCAKESVYKTWFPITGRWLGFQDADITIAPDGTFTARILVHPAIADGRTLDEFHGRWRAADGLLLAAIAVPA